MLRASILSALLTLLSWNVVAQTAGGTYQLQGTVFLDEGKRKVKNSVPGATVMAYEVLRGLSGEPVAYELADSRQIAKTDENGLFSVELRSDREYELRCVAEGYRCDPQAFVAGSVAPGDNITIEVPVERGKTFLLQGRTLDQNTRLPVAEAKVTLVQKGSSVTETVLSGRDGSFLFSLPQGSAFVANAAHRDYFFTTSDSVFTRPEAPQALQTVELLMPEIVIGQSRVLEGFRFEVNSAQVLPEMHATLDRLSEMLQANPRLKLIVNCHTDARGDERYNLDLTQFRAEAVASYLKSKGVSETRLKPVGYGEQQILNECKEGVLCTTERHLENRRTEIVITDSF